MSCQAPKQLVRLTQAQLDEVVRLHTLFLVSRGGRRAVLAGYDLSGLDLFGGDMSNADCTGSSFFGASLCRSKFDSATLFACDFRQANMEDVSMMHADLRGCLLRRRDHGGRQPVRGGSATRRARHARQGWRFPCRGAAGNAWCRLGGGFHGTDLTNASLTGAVAMNTDFSDAVMRGCKLVRAHIRGANFTGSNLQGADFAQADTRDACFRGAMIAGATFEYANMAGADLQGALSDKPNGRLVAELHTSLDELLRLHRQFIESCGAAGSALDLSGFDLRTAGAFAGACLTMLTAHNAVFYGLDLSRLKCRPPNVPRRISATAGSMGRTCVASCCPAPI